MAHRWASPYLIAAALTATVPESAVACELRDRHFRTRPEFRPVGYCLTHRAVGAAARGHILVTPRSRPAWYRGDQDSVMILTGSGRLVWYSRRPRVAYDLNAVRYRGRRLLSFHQAYPRARSHHLMLDERYRIVKRVRMPDGRRTNLHEMQVTPQGTAYVSAYREVRHRGERVREFVVREVDLETGKGLFRWRSLDDVPVSASYQHRTPGEAFDYFHGNSIEPPTPRDPTIIVSARNTSAVYGIDRRTGALRWTLGGKRDQFNLGQRSWFCAQHDARRLPNGDLSLFDDGGLALGNLRDCPVHPARVLRFRLDTRRRRARLVRTIPSHDGSSVRAMGSARRLPNGDTLINWGTSGLITQVSPRGEIVLGLRLQRYSYRAVRTNWVGRPMGRPAVVARRRSSGTDVWVSWNGATEVRRWRVLAGRSTETLRRVPRVFRLGGFETRMRIPGRPRYVAVRALARDGATLGESRAVRVR